MPVSVRLDKDTRQVLEQAARDRGQGLSAYLREIAAAEARRVRCELIRQQSQEVADYIASSKEAQEFNADWTSGGKDWP